MQPELVGDPWRAAAIGPMKPSAVAAALRASDLPLHWIVPEPASREDLYRAHDPTFVDDVLDGRRPNAFGTHSRDLARSLPYTSGAVYTAALAALDTGVSASLTGGFHLGAMPELNRCTALTWLLAELVANGYDGESPDVAIEIPHGEIASVRTEDAQVVPRRTEAGGAGRGCASRPA